MELTTPPRSDPDNLTEVCQILRGSPMARGEVTEKAESGDSAISASITYGQRLGFIEEGEDDKLQLTDLGSRLHYNRGDEEEVASIFRSAICNFSTYQALLKELAIDATDIVRDERVIQQSTIVEELDLTFGFDASEGTLEEYANTFLKSLAKANLGEYVVGRREYQTRLVVIEDFDTEVAKLFAEDDDGEEAKRETEKTGNSDSPEETIESEQISSQSPAPPIETRLNIDFSISGDDDPENVLCILQALRQGLAGEDTGANEGHATQDTPKAAGQLPAEVKITRTEPDTASSDEVANSGPRDGADMPQMKNGGDEKSVVNADEENESTEPQSQEDEGEEGEEDGQNGDENSSLSNF